MDHTLQLQYELTLWGFKSLCNTRCVWQYPTPFKICCIKLRTICLGKPTLSRISSLVCLWSINVFKSCCTYSKTRYNPPGVAWITSKSWTTLLCVSSRRREISRMTLQGTPPSGVVSAYGIRLMATVRLVER